jgi:hypothetical protein
MFIEETEARERWCPFAGQQRQQRQDENCMGGYCMAWVQSEANQDFGRCGLVSAGGCGEKACRGQ